MLKPILLVIRGLGFVNLYLTEMLLEFDLRKEIKQKERRYVIMLRKKSEIIAHIQAYHKQLAKLYHEIYERMGDPEIRPIVFNLYEHEIFREKYLEKHKIIAEAMNCWLDFPCDRLSDQITECFTNISAGSDITMEEFIRLEMHFDDCLIRIYNILASENEMSETVNNIFYYMLKKTRKEEDTLAHMFCNSRNRLKYAFSQDAG
ncbi:MAG: hypothetical protein JXA61_06830 [Bacteroidales bacterium]|nr:hypothetical protein [Bacteroidales bacterium]